jgi:NAD(P)-dependent dehydrogenase (short-subunit alcohol dehydrogenase family)
VQRRFDGKTFIVTGAGTGFGAALSQRAAEEGAAKVIVHYRNSAGGAERTAEVVLSGTPAGKIPTPEEMTGAALFLASEDAHHITGSYMIADGGYSMLGA